MTVMLSGAADQRLPSGGEPLLPPRSALAAT